MRVQLVLWHVNTREWKLRQHETYFIPFDHAGDLVRMACVHCTMVEPAYSVAHFRQDIGYARVLFEDDGPLAL